MKISNETIKSENQALSNINHKNLIANCKDCFGLCCVALYFSASEGFPEDKEAGKPCINLCNDFKCKVHGNLRELGLKGCTAYDCFGAGQKVSQNTYKNISWRENSTSKKEMFDAFLILRQLHEMLWYITGALSLKTSSQLHEELISIYHQIEKLTFLEAKDLLSLDITTQRMSVNPILAKVSENIRKQYNSGKRNFAKSKRFFGGGLDLIGKDLRKTDLRGEDLRGAYLIADNLSGIDLSGADLIGADLRDADLSGSNLSMSIFLTQAQINSAKGDSTTRLPKYLNKPQHWTL